MTPGRVAAPLVLLALLAAAAPAAGQVPTEVESETRIQVFDPDGRLEPGTTTSLLTAVTYRYGQGARADEPTEVHLSVLSTPGWAEAEFNTSTVTFPVPATSATSGRTDEVRVTLNVTPDADAPAFAGGEVAVRAEAEANGNIAASQGDDTQAVPPDYVATLRIDHRDRNPVPGGRLQALPLHVQAHVNDRTLVDVEVEAKPANSQVTVPGPTPLEGAVTGNASAFLDVDLRMPWTRDQEGTLSLALTPYSANRTDVQGSAVTVEMTLVGRSLVPGPGAGAVLAALAGAAAARGRR